MKKTLLLTSLLCMLLIVTAAQARYRNDNLDRIRIEGRVESIRGQIAYIESDCGTAYRVHLGPAWYWDEHDYFLSSGSWVTIIAWQDAFDGYCYAGEIRGRNFCYDLCNSHGFPRWSNHDDYHPRWRPTRSFFDVCFVISIPVWHDGHCGPHYDNDRDRWQRRDRDHGGNWGRGRDDDRDRDRDGRRGGRRNVNEGGGRDNNPGGNLGDYQVKKPDVGGGGWDKNPGGEFKNPPRTEKRPAPVVKPNNSGNSRDSKSNSNYKKPSRNEKARTSKSLARK